ncbi:radical SAM protein [bacterium]|nr:radical SAM protein [bacterium]
MECAVITTYRCNAHCAMCNCWANPSDASKEFRPEILTKIPEGMTRLNITGGEPMLRRDIEDIVEALDKKTNRLEISTNGYFTDRIVNVAKKYHDITIRVSLEGLPKLNDKLRGIQNGFDHGLRTILKLQDLKVEDIGFAMVISDQNAVDLLDLYHLAASMGVEFSTSTMHNSFYFFKDDNRIEKLDMTLEYMKEFIKALLQSRRKNLKLRAKDWFRAYLGLGLMRFMKGEQRSLPCEAGTDFFFLDPYGKVLACNGSDEPWVMGDLNTQDFEEIWHSEQAVKVRKLVAKCDKNCWMMGSAVPAMRKKLPTAIKWVMSNKIRLMTGKDIKLY